VRSVELRARFLVDFSSDGAPIGIELTDPAHVEVDQINEVLAAVGAQAIEVGDLAPLRAA
jgi:hypothetical protein